MLKESGSRLFFIFAFFDMSNCPHVSPRISAAPAQLFI